MDKSDLVEQLDSSSKEETPLQTSLREQTHRILNLQDTDINSTLYDLLTNILKLLFSKSHHPAITSTGRKKLVQDPSVPNRFGDDSIFDPPPPWKTPWTIPLLSWILNQYSSTSPLSTSDRKKAVEAHFHLLVPPLLNLVDDTDIHVKAQGCHCLATLCSTLVDTQSDMLRRTGLAEVFLDALKACFHHLPSLTEEQDSLLLLREVYPAWLAVVDARFTLLSRHTTVSTTKPRPDFTEADHPQKSPLTPTQISSETTLRTTHLSTLFRHSLLHSLRHLNTTPSSPASTASPDLTAFLVSQVPLVLEAMHAYAAVHLQTAIPVLVGMMRDPFAAVAPRLLGEVVGALEGVVTVCWARVRERWWGEVLRGCVEAWISVRDEIEVEPQVVTGKKGLRDVVARIERVVEVLRSVVGEEFEGVIAVLVAEEVELKELFAGIGGETKIEHRNLEVVEGV